MNRVGRKYRGESNCIAIFITHTWADLADYHEIVRLISNAPTLRWINKSIPANEPVPIFFQGKEAIAQAEEQLHRREQVLRKRIEATRTLVFELDRRVNLEHFIHRERRKITRILRHMKESGKGERLIEFERNYRMKQLSTMVRHIKTQPVDAKTRSALQRAETSLTKLKRSCAECEASIEQLGRFRALEFKIFRSSDKQSSSGRRSLRSKAFRGNPNLALILYNRILESDIVLLIADMYGQYRQWMEFEFEAAVNLDKPIIAIKPSCQKRFPREILRRCFRCVEISGLQIVKAIHDAIDQTAAPPTSRNRRSRNLRSLSLVTSASARS